MQYPIVNSFIYFNLLFSIVSKYNLHMCISWANAGFWSGRNKFIDKERSQKFWTFSFNGDVVLRFINLTLICLEYFWVLWNYIISVCILSLMLWYSYPSFMYFFVMLEVKIIFKFFSRTSIPCLKWLPTLFISDLKNNNKKTALHEI